MRRAQILIVMIVAAILVLAGCGGASESGSAPITAPAAQATAAPAMEAPAAPLEPGPAGGNTDNATADPQAQTSQRLVIKNAFVSIQVPSVSEAEASIRARAAQLGGYVVSVQTNGSDEYLTSNIIFRVPAARFDEALSGVEGLARKVLSRTVSGDDVTEEFVDLESRLRNLEATRERLLGLLERATRVQDALEVNNALTDVQGEIEQIKGRMQYLTQSAAFSTITADLQPVPPAPTIIEEDGWQPLRVAQEALRDLVLFGQGLLNLLIVLGVWAPIWLPLLLVGIWLWRRAGAGRAKAA